MAGNHGYVRVLKTVFIVAITIRKNEQSSPPPLLTHITYFKVTMITGTKIELCPHQCIFAVVFFRVQKANVTIMRRAYNL